MTVIYRRYISDPETFEAWWNERAVAVHTNARDKGFWDSERNDAEMLCLVHSELSEAAESLWRYDPKSEKIPEYSGFLEELADALIRLMDQTTSRKWNVVPLVLHYGKASTWKQELTLSPNFPADNDATLEDLLLKAHFMISSALEDLRKKRDPSIALAKTIVLIEGAAVVYGAQDFGAVVDAKMAYNRGRERLHGKAF